MTEQPQRSQLELYAHVIAAYRQAGFWPLSKQAYLESGDKWRAKGWFWITLIALAYIALVVIALAVIRMAVIISFYYSIAIILIFVGIIFLSLINKRDLDKKIEILFKGDIGKYGSLVKIYKESREFTRYLLFRNALMKYKLGKKDVENVESLFNLDQQTFGSYVAQKPLKVWIASTLTAVLAASATTWPFEFVVQFCLIGLSCLLILYVFPEFTGNDRRRYELHRWLAWYKAEAPKVSTPSILTPDGANPLPD